MDAESETLVAITANTDEVFIKMAIDTKRGLGYIWGRKLVELDSMWFLCRYLLVPPTDVLLEALRRIHPLSRFPPGLLPLCMAFIGRVGETPERFTLLPPDRRGYVHSCVVHETSGDVYALISENTYASHCYLLHVPMGRFPWPCRGAMSELAVPAYIIRQLDPGDMLTSLADAVNLISDGEGGIFWMSRSGGVRPVCFPADCKAGKKETKPPWWASRIPSTHSLTMHGSTGMPCFILNRLVGRLNSKAQTVYVKSPRGVGHVKYIVAYDKHSILVVLVNVDRHELYLWTYVTREEVDVVIKTRLLATIERRYSTTVASKDWAFWLNGRSTLVAVSLACNKK